MIKIADWILYTIWAVLGLMMLDFLVGLVRSLVTKSFSPRMVLNYLKDILYYVLPLMLVVSWMSLDPTGWILRIFFFVGALALVWNYLISIKNKWKV